MTDRIIDLSERPAYLSVRNSVLNIRFGEEEPVTVPLSDLAVVIASHPQITFSHAVLSGIAMAGGVFISCDEKHLPVAMLLPLVTHSLQAEKFAAQASAPLPTQKRLWQQIVKAKLQAQARLLEERTGNHFGLPMMVPKVRSGDPENVEAHAAQIYWKRLFGDPPFRRDRDAEDLNRHLNYGYAVLRAVTARAVCAAGLHPSLGIHHHNRYDAFCLADDIMEPFRPVVDRVVAKLRDAHGPEVPLDKDSKRALLEGLLARFTDGDESRTLFDWIGLTAFSLAAVIENKGETLNIPGI